MGLLGKYFNAAVGEGKTFLLIFRLALAILCGYSVQAIRECIDHKLLRLKIYWQSLFTNELVKYSFNHILNIKGYMKRKTWNVCIVTGLAGEKKYSKGILINNIKVIYWGVLKTVRVWLDLWYKVVPTTVLVTILLYFHLKA